MSGISIVAPAQSFAPPQPTTQPSRPPSNTPPDHEGSSSPATTTPNARVLNVTA
jgi:hypothetical protein